MKNSLVPVADRTSAILDLADKTRDYIDQSKAPNTRRAYRSDWSDFAAWCDSLHLDSLPAAPDTVAGYLVARADTLKTSTLSRRLAAISQAHQMAGHPSPVRSAAVHAVWSGIRRTHGTAQTGKAPVRTDDLKAMVRTLGDSVKGRRDRALLLLGFSGAFRRSELVALDVRDLAFTAEGLVVTIRKSKTDQTGEGRTVGIPHGQSRATCPVRALRAWLNEVGITDGPVFRSLTKSYRVKESRLPARAVALIVKATAEAAGLDPAQYAGHSLRAGLATSAAAAGVEERDIMRQTGHRSERILRRYIREGSLFRSNAAGRVGL